MNNLQSSAIVLELCTSLGEHGSWCGETHVQKGVFFLQALANVPLELPFILYKHGPFSFELRDKLTEMRADGLLAVVPRQYPYGPSLEVTEAGQRMKKRFPNTIGRHAAAIEFVGSRIGSLGVTELERLSTALFVRKELGANISKAKRVQRILELKPHVEPEAADEAIDSVEGLVKEFRAQ